MLSTFVDRPELKVVFYTDDVDALVYDPVACLLRFEDISIVSDSIDSSMRVTRSDQDKLYCVGKDTFAGTYGTLIRLGRLTGTFPTDAEHAHMIHEWIDIHIRFREPINILCNTDFEQRLNAVAHKQMKSYICDFHIPQYFHILEDEIRLHGRLACMDKTTIADLLWKAEIKWLIENNWVTSLDDYVHLKSFVFPCSEDETTDIEEMSEYDDDLQSEDEPGNDPTDQNNPTKDVNPGITDKENSKECEDKKDD